MPRIRTTYQSRTTLKQHISLYLAYEAVTLYGRSFQNIWQVS